MRECAAPSGSRTVRCRAHGWSAGTTRPGPHRPRYTREPAHHEWFWHSAEMRSALGLPGFTVDDDTIVVAQRFVLRACEQPSEVSTAR
ncbi:MAG: hypothetical protein GEU98_14265 [Pseudonocardiaceae bacterium]|nr:hypothetical protein [Pseudonocardiaceae bacterium]